MKKLIVNPRWLTQTPKNFSTLVKQAKEIDPQVEYTFSLESLINRLNNATSADQIPDVILFDYLTTIIDRNLNPSEVYSVIDLSAKIARSRLSLPHTEIIMSGVSTGLPMTRKSVNDLKLAGFRGQSLGPFMFGMDGAMSTRASWVKDEWHGIFTNDSVSVNSNPLQIDLTYRQQQICNLICDKGLTNSQIAKKLDISESTVKMHIGILLKKYAVRSRSQLSVTVAELKDKLDNQRRLRSRL